MRYVSRDPFARHTVESKVVPVVSQTCKWCGNVRKGNKLVQFYITRDGIYTRPEAIDGLFCSRGCAEDYHGSKF